MNYYSSTEYAIKEELDQLNIVIEISTIKKSLEDLISNIVNNQSATYGDDVMQGLKKAYDTLEVTQRLLS